MDVDDFLFHLFGTTYLIAWTSVYYPQIVLNFRTKSFTGLSAGFVFYNTWGFLCYTVYNVTRVVVQKNFDLPESVTTHDVLFASHAFFCCLLLCFQLYCYHEPERQSSPTPLISAFDKLVLGILIIIPCSAFILSCNGVIDWITTNGFSCDDCSFIHQFTFIQVLGYVKVGVTLFKYPSQIRLNYLRRSTAGLSFWSYILDTTGASCSVAQNVVHALFTKDWEFVLGNVPKLGLGTLSLFYCIVIIGQIFYYKRYKASYIKLGVDDRISTGTALRAMAQTIGVRSSAHAYHKKNSNYTLSPPPTTSTTRKKKKFKTSRLSLYNAQSTHARSQPTYYELTPTSAVAQPTTSCSSSAASPYYSPTCGIMAQELDEFEDIDEGYVDNINIWTNNNNKIKFNNNGGDKESENIDEDIEDEEEIRLVNVNSPSYRIRGRNMFPSPLNQKIADISLKDRKEEIRGEMHKRKGRWRGPTWWWWG